MSSISKLIQNDPEHFVVGCIRILMGFVFLWPFLDKLFGLGYATSPSQSFLSGGSPTSYYLGNVNPNGPFTFFFTDTLGSMTGIIDILYLATLGFAGITLITGVLVRFGSIAGAIFMQSILLAEWPIAPPAGTLVFNPLIDEHVVYFFILILFLIVNSGQWIGLGNKWKNKVGERWILQ